jgi:phage FluMu gp28-like protein
MKKSERAQFLIDNLDLPGASGVDDARWEHFQIAHLSDDSTFRIENKSRQIAWSFSIAMEAVANAVLYGRSSVFQSINLSEAQEKIRYARTVLEHLHIAGLPAITVPDTTTALGFENNARILSAPGNPGALRGKAQFWVYLDEFAHQRQAKENYTTAVPVLSKGGKLRAASSPMGASGMFWEIFTQSFQKYPGYTRKSTPWWEVQAFSKNVKAARKLAPTLDTFARVDMFGTDRIQAIFANMPLEDFRQEYECEFVDESTAWITWEEIRAAQSQGETLVCLLAEARGKNLAAVREAIDQLLPFMRQGQVENALAGGMDVGRVKNTSELYFVGKGAAESYPLRLALTLDNLEFDDQLDLIVYALTRLPVSKFLIDRTGLGRQLAENAAKRFPTKVEGVDFTNASKSVWATDGKMLIQKRKTPLPVNRDMAYQIHSIKKIVTGSNVFFDTEQNTKHHADKAWAWFLALAAAIGEKAKKVARAA